MAARGPLLALVALLALACGARAQAPPPAEMLRTIVGAWELSNAERDRTCTVAMRAPVGSAAGALAWDRACAEAFPFTRMATGWRIAGRDAIQLVEASGALVVEFSEVESGMYEGRRAGDGLLFLQNITNGPGDELRAEQLAGDWNLVRQSGRPLCGLVFATTRSGPDAFALRLKPGCDALVTRFAPTTWRLDRGQLVLGSARQETWRFEESEPMVWRRIPEGRQPLQLVRP